MKKSGTLSVLLAALLWGSNGVFVNILADSGLNNIERTSFRLLIAAVLEALIVFFSDKEAFRIGKKDLFWSVLTGAIGIFAFLVFYTFCIVRVGMGVAGVLIYLMPAIVLIYNVVTGKEELNAVKVISVVMNLTGCALVSGIASGGSFDLLGIAMGVLTALCYAFNNIVLAEKFEDCRPMTKVFYPALFAALLALIYLLLFSV